MSKKGSVTASEKTRKTESYTDRIFNPRNPKFGYVIDLVAAFKKGFYGSFSISSRLAVICILLIVFNSPSYNEKRKKKRKEKLPHRQKSRFL